MKNRSEKMLRGVSMTRSYLAAKQSVWLSQLQDELARGEEVLGQDRMRDLRDRIIPSVQKSIAENLLPENGSQISGWVVWYSPRFA